MIWGHKDGTAIAAAVNAAGCAAINLPGGAAILVDQPFGITPTTISNCGLQQLVATISVPVPFMQGPIGAGTTLVITPDFNYAGCTGTGGVNPVCIGSAMGGIFYTQIWGTGLTSATNANCPSSAKTFVTTLATGGSFNGFNVSGVCPGSPGNAVELNSLDSFWFEGGAQQSFTTACVGRSTDTQTYQLDCLNSAVGGSSVGWLQSSGINQDFGTYLIGGLTISSGANYQSHSAHFIGGGSTNTAVTCAGTWLSDGDFVGVDAGTANAVQMNSGCNLQARNTVFTNNNAGGNIINNVAGSKFVDQGGNSLNGPGVFAALFGAWRGDSVYSGSCSGTATSSSTLGMYGLGESAALTCTSTVVNLGQVMTDARTVRGLAVVAGTGGFNASSGVFTVLKNGGATTVTCTTGTATSCFDGTHTVAFAAGDVLSIQFTTQATETLANVKATVIAW